MFLQRFRALLLVSALLTWPGRAAHAQDPISGFQGVAWGRTREAILARFGTPREDLQQDSLERINYVQGPDSGYLFGLTRRHGLVAGIRILPLVMGGRCSAAVGTVKAQLTRQFGGLAPLETKTADSSEESCGGYKEWNLLWRDGAGNRVLLSVDVGKHRIYISYSSRFSPF